MEKSLAKNFLPGAIPKKEPDLSEEEIGVPTTKKPRTSEDFYLFCKFILEYENYELVKKEESNGSHSKSTKKVENRKRDITVDTNQHCQTVLHKLSCRNSESCETEDRKSVLSVDDLESTDEDSYDLVTCFCRKPFAGRPMIECSKCLTWIHLSCAKVKKTNIPDVYICPSCKEPTLF